MGKKWPTYKLDRMTLRLPPCDVPRCKNQGNFSSALNKETNKLMNFCESCTKVIRRLRNHNLNKGVLNHGQERRHYS
jgi:hypothetical protein